MYFSTFILIMCVTVGVIALGAAATVWLLKQASLAAYRNMRKMRPVRVVSPLVNADNSLSGEWLKATSSGHQSSVFEAVGCAPLEGKLASKQVAMASHKKLLPARI